MAKEFYSPLYMEYKRKILNAFQLEIDRELEYYTKEYQRILRDTTLIIGENDAQSSASVLTEAKNEELETNQECKNISYEAVDENLLLSPTKDIELRATW